MMLATTARSRGTVTFFVGFLVLYICAALYLRSACFRDPTSAFFRPEEARVLSYSGYRKVQARKYADQAGQHAPAKWQAESPSHRPDVCVAIGSVSRHGFSYLKETLGSILEGLDDAERQRLYVVVFLAHTNQSAHEDFDQPWLRNMADSLPQYPDTSAEALGFISALENDSSYAAHARKQKNDYTVLLDACAQVNPTYTMTIEDDVIALDGWFHRLLAALDSAKRQAKEMGQESFLYLRIFYDGRLLGWNSEEWITYLVACSSVVLGELVVLGALYHPRSPVSSAFTRKALTPLTMFLVCAVCTPMSIGLYFLAGRSCMLPRRPGVELMHKYGCCAQGLVFPQEQVVENLLPMYARSSRAEDGGRLAVDSFMEQWADGQRDENNVNRALRFAVTPVLIQHVGGKSSHGAGDQVQGRLTDDMPFDYGFETNDPVQLAKEHELWLEMKT